MSELQPSCERKRQRAERCPLHLNGASRPRLKRQKLDLRSREVQPAQAFWDTLSKIWLTKRALREFDRRNSQPDVSSSHLLRVGPQQISNHHALAEQKQKFGLNPNIADLRSNCRLTNFEEIKKFAKNGGPDLSDLRGYPEPFNSLSHSMSSSRSSRGRGRGSKSTYSTKPTTRSPQTETTGTYDPNFHQKLIDGGIYPYGYEDPDGRVPPKPRNWQEIRERLRQYRPSLSSTTFSEEQHEQFQRADARVSKENKATKRVIPIIEGNSTHNNCIEDDIKFTNLAPLTDDVLTAAKPDVYHGARPEQLSRNIRNDLTEFIIPSKHDHLPMAPNFFLEAKGPDGSASVAKLQACYDGALGARSMHSLQSYGQDESAYDNNAYSISSTYHSGTGTLQMYTSHLSQPKSAEDRPEYYMNQLGAYAMTDGHDTFRRGATAYRNARDWAKEQRDEAIEQANRRESNPKSQAIDARFSAGRDFPTGGPDDDPRITDYNRQDTRTTSHRDHGTSDVGGSSSDPLASDYRVPVKRSSRQSKRARDRQPKRRFTDESSDAESSNAFNTLSVPQSPLTNASWSWDNGKFLFHNGDRIVKEQEESPADVWVYYDQGWPGQRGKKWRYWDSSTQETTYIRS